MCVHASGSVWVWNHDGWAAEEQRAGDCVHRRAVRLHPSPLNAAAAAAPRLRDTMLTSQWILGDLSCQVAGFKPREDAIHNSILILYPDPFISPFIYCFSVLHYSYSHFVLLSLCFRLPAFPRVFISSLRRHFSTFLSVPWTPSLISTCSFTFKFTSSQRTVKMRQHAFFLQPRCKTFLYVGMFWCDSPARTLYKSVSFISHVRLGRSS